MEHESWKSFSVLCDSSLKSMTALCYLLIMQTFAFDAVL